MEREIDKDQFLIVAKPTKKFNLSKLNNFYYPLKMVILKIGSCSFCIASHIVIALPTIALAIAFKSDNYRYRDIW